MTQAAKMTQLAIAALEDKKAEDITLIDIAKVSVLADYFLIANGNNRNQVQAMADNVDEQLTKAGYSLKSMEGYPTGNWILMDYGDLVVHVFDRQNRAYLERWRADRRGCFSGREVVVFLLFMKHAFYIKTNSVRFFSNWLFEEEVQAACTSFFS